jgi:hypothetical protein
MSNGRADVPGNVHGLMSCGADMPGHEREEMTPGA